MKTTTVILAFFFNALLANAQLSTGLSNQNVAYGIKAGINIATLLNSEGSKPLIEFNCGGFVRLKLDDKFAIQPEALFSSQGAKLEKRRINTYYINVPIMVKYNMLNSYYIEAGPQISFLLFAKSKPIIGESVDVTKDFNSIDFGLNFGVGYEFTENIYSVFRYNLGLFQMQKELLPDESALHNSVFQISVGYKF